MKRSLIKLAANIAAARHTDKTKRRLERDAIIGKLTRTIGTTSKERASLDAHKNIQDVMFPEELRQSKDVIVFLTLEDNVMNGGVYSIFSITQTARSLKPQHGKDVILMTRPNSASKTYFRNTNFRNSENVFRFDQIKNLSKINSLSLNIPEVCVNLFMANLDRETEDFLKSVPDLHINILNQNINLMPDREQIDQLRELTNHLTQSVAHHAYFTRATAEKWQLPTLLLPAFVDLSAYSALQFSDKSKTIIYSPDNSAIKEKCLQQIRGNFPKITLIEIRDIPFEKYIELASTCIFSITFGEGLDGYLTQPTQLGGVGFAAYNDDFFPSPEFKKMYNIFEDEADMLAKICERIRALETNAERYQSVNRAFLSEFDKLYDRGDYRNRVLKLCKREMEIIPGQTL